MIRALIKVGGKNMGLTNNKEEQLKKMPIIEFKVSKSKDGRFIIHKTTTTDIKPVAYYNKVLASSGSEDASSLVVSDE
jgi:hypothetical protein